MMFLLPILGPWLVKRGLSKAWTMGIQAIVIITLLAVAYLAYSKVQGHFQHIRDLEAANAQLQTDKGKLQAQVDQVVETNQNNQAVHQTTTEIVEHSQAIATQERADTQTRTAKLEDIRREIHQTPPTAQPVAPVVLRTIDRLWDDEPGEAPDDQDRHQGTDGQDRARPGAS
jgi:Tfp pilus assembly protein PilN